MFYYRARYYDVALGRFTARDLILYSDGFNLYAYVGGRPTNATDPSGMAVFSLKETNINSKSSRGDVIFSAIHEAHEIAEERNQNPNSTELDTVSGGPNIVFVRAGNKQTGEGIGGTINFSTGKIHYFHSLDGTARKRAQLFADFTMPSPSGAFTGIGGLFGKLTRCFSSGSKVLPHGALTGAERATADLAGKIRFTEKAGRYMGQAGRYVPRHTLAQAIQHGTRMADPQGAPGAIKVLQEVFVNGKPKTLEIIWRESDNTILHFLYK